MREAAIAELRDAIGDDAVRLVPGWTPESRPGCIAEPADTWGVRAVMGWAATNGLTVVPIGGGTKAGWGGRPRAFDVTLATGRLTGLIEHAGADLTATVRAGSRLVDVNRGLAAQGQWIPIDPLGTPAATIGGVLACDDSGPRRHRYGAPRDLLIGTTFVTAEGTLARSGGRVVKNVAGYDIGRLLTGSLGGFGVIVEATFKLSPRPEASRTVEIGPADPQRIVTAAQAVATSQLTPSALELEWPPARLLVRFESVLAAAVGQAADTVRIAADAGLSARVVDGADEEALWLAHGLAESDGSAEEVAHVRLGVPPASIGDELDWLARALDRRALEGTYVGRAALGTGRLTMRGGLEAVARVAAELHQRYEPMGGHVMLLEGSPALEARIDPMGPQGDARRLVAAVKRHFDPRGTLARWAVS